MKMYLLLRNNKQSGPHSLDELKGMGLKAYDLVWLEGKSAAWRYPSEIEELSSFAPIVEEQPFDRFYKKASPAIASGGVDNDDSRSVSVRTTNEVPVVVEPQRSSPLSSPMSTPMSSGKRIIYVTMPAGKSPVSRETAIRENQREATTRELPRAAIEDYSAQPSAGHTTTVDYVPRRQSRRTALKTKTITRFVAIGLCILALLAAGIFIGLSLNKDTLGLPHKMVVTAANDNSRNDNSRNGSATNAGQPIVHPTAQQLPVPAVTPPSVSTREEQRTVSNSAVPAKTLKATQPSSKAKERSTQRSTFGGVQYTTAPAQKDSATATIPSMQREAVHRSDNAETNRTGPASVDKEALRTAVANQVSVGANTYSVGTFGGISDLQVTVTNRSAYPLDLVVVEVQYVQANKKVFKTENLYFRGIGAGSALMLEAPKSSRGIKVQYKVTTINSRELGLPGS